MSAKKHIKGTNGRTFCGVKIQIYTTLVKDEPLYMSDCSNCLGRLSSDYVYMIECLKLLRNIRLSSGAKK